jgi:hypothetical protein
MRRTSACRVCSLFLAAAVVWLVVLGSAASATKPGSYCSPSLDVCYGAFTTYSPKTPSLDLDLSEKLFARYRLCVTAPNHVRDCHRFRVRRVGGGDWGSRIRWSRHFPRRGRGTYVARWLSHGRALGPAITFPIPFVTTPPQPTCCD